MVTRRMLGCDDAPVTRRTQQTTVEMTRKRPTESFYFAHGHASDDESEREEEGRAGELAHGGILAEKWKRIANRLQWANGSRSDEDRKNNSRNRSARDESGAEKRAGADVLLVPGPSLPIDPRADEAACEDGRGCRDRQIQTNGE